jgi:segregation and condensation protein B
MEIGNIIPHIEALIFASDKPLTSMEITELINNAFGFMEEKLTLEQIQTSIDGIIEKYASEFYPFEVRESGGGWQFLTKKDFHKTVAQLNGEKFLKRLSSAALETLSIIAYKQPITKGEIEAIRGVSSDYSIQKLLEKELIIISGRNEEMPGKPLVYATSKTFMDYFGINSAADLPKLKEVYAETLIEATVINHSPDEILPEEGTTTSANEGTNAPEGTEAGEESVLIVSESGELISDSPDSEDDSISPEEKEIEEEESAFDQEEGAEDQEEGVEEGARDQEEEAEEPNPQDSEDKESGNDNKTGDDDESEDNPAPGHPGKS